MRFEPPSLYSNKLKRGTTYYGYDRGAVAATPVCACDAAVARCQETLAVVPRKISVVRNHCACDGTGGRFGDADAGSEFRPSSAKRAGEKAGGLFLYPRTV